MKKPSAPYYATYLRAELNRRNQANRAYSLRAFARDLRVDVGALSAVLNERRIPSLRMAECLVNQMDLDATEARKLLSSVVEVQKKRPLKRRDPRVREFVPAPYENSQALDLDLFCVIADWYHAAILELTYAPDFEAEPNWIMKKLGITYIEAKSALQRLIEYELIRRVDGRWEKVHEHLELKDVDQTSSARRRKQKQIREKAIDAILRDPIETRHMSSITMCIDPTLLPEARRRIEEFNDSLCAFLESGKRTDVYAMEIGLFSLQRITNYKTKTKKPRRAEARKVNKKNGEKS